MVKVLLRVEGFVYSPCFMLKLLLHDGTVVMSYISWFVSYLLNKRLKKSWVINFPYPDLERS